MADSGFPISQDPKLANPKINQLNQCSRYPFLFQKMILNESQTEAPKEIIYLYEMENLNVSRQKLILIFLIMISL